MASKIRMTKTTVCWISSARYSNPLDAAMARKWEMMAQLREYDIRVIGFSNSWRPRRFTEQAHFYLIPQPPVSILRYLMMFALAPLLLLALVFRHNGKVLVAQSPFEGAVGAWVKSIARLFGKKLRLIIENHNNFEEDVFLQRDVPFERLYRSLMSELAGYAFRHGDAMRVISSSTARRARHYAPHLPQVRFMTWSNTDIFQQTERTVPVEESEDLVYAGALIPRKGLHHLLAAFAQLKHPTARLYLVGHPENADYAAALQQQAAQLDIASRVHFIGEVSQQGLADYFGKSRALALPSLSEGLGRVVVEAMLLGMPVIGSRAGGIPDMIIEGENGYLIDPDDADSLADALRRIYRADVKIMGAKARDFAQDFFSPEKYLNGYRQLFKIALAGKQRDPAAKTNRPRW